MKKILIAAFALVVSLCAPADAFLNHGQINTTIPVVTPGALVPTSQTALQASASTWGPMCGGTGDAGLDAAWGAGCNTSTHLCAAPTSGTPLETCTPPQMFVVTGGSGNGTTATINYTSYAHYTYPNATPLIISGATQSNWNTPPIGVTSFASGGTSPNFTMTLGCQQATSSPPSPPGFGDGCGSLTASQGLNVGQVTGTSDPVSGFIGVAQGWPAFSSFSGSCTSGTNCVLPTSSTWPYTNIPVTGGSGTGGTVNLTVNSSGAVTLASWNQRGTGYLDGDVVGANTAGISRLSAMTNFTGTLENAIVTSPNGPWTAQSASATQVVINTGTHQVVGTLNGLNTLGYSGTVQQPFIVSSSTCNIGGVPEHCSVTFPNAHSCASSCVSASTQIVAGQFDDVIPIWHYGEQVQNSLQNTDARACGIVKHISPVAFVTISVDGGIPIKVTTAISENAAGIGAGQSGLDNSKVSTYCAHWTPDPAHDGLHEVRLVAYPTVGYAACLCSVQAVDGNTGSTFFAGHTHGYQPFTRVAVANSFDHNFSNHDWRTYSTGITITGGSASGGGTSTDTFNLTFTQPVNFPLIQPNQVFNVSGVVAGSSCAITGGTANGAIETLTTGGGAGCSFPVGSEINIAGIATTAWNGTAVPVTGGNGTTSIVVNSNNSGTVTAGGTIQSNWNGICQVPSTYTPASGSIICPQPFNTATTRTSGGTLTGEGQLYCVVGGAGDWPAPRDPAVPGNSSTRQTLYPDSFQLIAFNGSNCSGAANSTGCAVPLCGLQPTQAETLWLTRFDAGLDERKLTSGDSVYMNANGSLFLNTNAGQSIQVVDSHVDSWLTSAGGTACRGGQRAAGTPTPAFTGSYCSDINHAETALNPTANGVTQTLGNNVSGCLTFTAATNSTAPTWYTGEPVLTVGLYDGTVVGTDTNGNATPALRQWGVYWVQSLVGTALTLATTPQGACITELSSGIHGTVTLSKDLGMSNILLACDTTATNPCSNSNPQTHPAKVQSGSATIFAKAGYLTVAPDTNSGSTFPATQLNTILAQGEGAWTNSAISQGGRVRLQNLNAALTTVSLNSVNSVGPTPAIQTVTNGAVQTGGTLPGGKTCPSTCETLTFANLTGAGTAWQVADSTGSPGQGVITSGILGSSGTWDCPGTATAPCHIIDATSTTASFVNAGASGTWTSGGTQKLIPATLIIEFAPGTFAYNSGSNPTGLCSISNVAVNTGSAQVCMSGNSISGNAVVNGNSTAHGLPFIPGAFTFSVNNSCMPQGSFQSNEAAPVVPIVSPTTPNMPVTPGSGGTNDIMELTWAPVGGVSAFNFQAFNACGTGPFVLTGPGWQLNAPGVNAATAGPSDIWVDSVNFSGPDWQESTTGPLSAGGANYITNSTFTDITLSVDHATYAWGSSASIAFSVCANEAVNVVDVSCTFMGANAVPHSLGGANVSGAIGGSFAVPITANVTAGDTTFSAATGTLPAGLSPGWLSNVECNFAVPLVKAANSGSPTTEIVGLVVILAYNNTTNPATVTLSSSANASCPTGSNPVMEFYNGVHVDAFFYSGNTDIYGGGFPWLAISNTIYENVQCVYCVQLQQLFIAGANYFNVAYEDVGFKVMTDPALCCIGVERSVTWGGYTTYNEIVRDSALWGSTPFTINVGPVQHSYFINNTGGTWLNFPYVANGNPWDQGFSGLSSDQNAPPSDAITGGGGMSSNNLTVWPTLSRGSDASGNPNVPAKSWSGSMSACPWYCAAGDTGLGSM